MPEDYFLRVYKIVKRVPKGRVTSYGAIASHLGLKAGARMVGWAMNKSHILPDVPAHRVVNRNGELTGKHHFGNPRMMQELLENEGLIIKNDRVIDFPKHFWDPRKEL